MGLTKIKIKRQAACHGGMTAFYTKQQCCSSYHFRIHDVSSSTTTKILPFCRCNDAIFLCPQGREYSRGKRHKSVACTGYHSNSAIRRTAQHCRYGPPCLPAKKFSPRIVCQIAPQVTTVLSRTKETKLHARHQVKKN